MKGKLISHTELETMKRTARAYSRILEVYYGNAGDAYEFPNDLKRRKVWAKRATRGVFGCSGSQWEWHITQEGLAEGGMYHVVDGLLSMKEYLAFMLAVTPAELL